MLRNLVSFLLFNKASENQSVNKGISDIRFLALYRIRQPGIGGNQIIKGGFQAGKNILMSFKPFRDLGYLI